MDDPRFESLTFPQWYLYSELIYQDRKYEIDQQTAFTEYLASFWNPEAVKKIQESRASASQHKFKSDQEFEDDILSGKYKENSLLDAIKKIRELEQQNKKQPMSNKHSPKSKLPTDLSSLHLPIEKINGRRK